MAPLPEPGASVPVYAIWPEYPGPLLSVGMLTACARQWEGGRLNQAYEIRRPETAASFLDDLAGRQGPAILLCSNYVWSLEHNLEAATAGRAIHPGLIVVHGGPSTPKYEADAERFLTEHREIAHVLARGEGEETLVELLDALEGAGRGVGLHADRLATVAGISFRDEDEDEDVVVRTAERARLADLDQLPSPYLTGEFDGLPPEAWQHCLSIETNRGCPYGCTFCDWGSATMSRIRKFSLDRVIAEMRWAAELGIETVTITDANFGIISRDVEISRALAEIRQETGAPVSVSWTAAKNTTKHLVRIMDLLVGSGVVVSTSLSLQTTDPSTLETLDRTNISTEHYVKLASEYRKRGFPLVGDLMLGLPGQTFDSYKADLQFMLEHEIMVRSWPVQMLPNAPMNAPEYRELHALEVGPDNLVTASATFDAEDRRRMWRFRNVDTIAERFGVLRHVMRYLQWDHGIPATDVEQHILDLVDEDPLRFPRISWVFSWFDLYPTVAGGWPGFYDEVARLAVEDYGLAPDDRGLETVLAVQRLLMPAPGRTFPARTELPHDYVDYYRSATRTLYTTGRASRPDRPLTAYPPASFTVDGDPMGLCTRGLDPGGDARSETMQGDFHVGAEVAYELDSPLLRGLPALGHHGMKVDLTWLGDDLDLSFEEPTTAGDEDDEASLIPMAPTRVAIAASGG
jgi:hypothetical protein